MIKIGITGSLSSGKTTASKILSLRKGPLFSADIVVKKLYRNHKFIRILSRKFNIPSHLNIKENVMHYVKLIILEVTTPCKPSV